MSDTRTPHFHNSAGHAVIQVGAREFQCIGAQPPYDHPHVFLDMGDDSEIVCPYCSTLYRFDASLKHGTANPADSVWHAEITTAA